MKRERIKITVYLEPELGVPMRKNAANHRSLSAYLRSLVEADITRSSNNDDPLNDRLDKVVNAIRYCAIAHDATLDRFGLREAVQKAYRQKYGKTSNAE